MDQARTDSAGADGKAVATWSAWETYYREASRRRRARGGRNQLREEKRRRRIKERLGIGVSTLFVAALTAVFYVILNR
jgi:hypothetical protein